MVAEEKAEGVDWPVAQSSRIRDAHQELFDLIGVKAVEMGINPFELSTILLNMSASLAGGFIPAKEMAYDIGQIAGESFTASVLYVVENRDKWMAMHRAGFGPDGRRRS
jgi:hypothetical protein